VTPQRWASNLEPSGNAMPGLEKAMAYFSRSVSIDADYAPAYSGLADTYVMRFFLDPGQPMISFRKPKRSPKKCWR